MAKIARNFGADATDPAFRIEACDVSAANYTPTGGVFRALNASVAGTCLITDARGTQVTVYLNTGWNSQGGTIVRTGGTATLLAAALEHV